jgi:hypothetical protein
VQDAVRLRVVRRVAALPHSLLVGEPKRVEHLHVLGGAGQLRLKGSDLGLRVAGRKARLQLRRDCGRECALHRGGRVVTEHAAEEAREGGGAEHRRPHEEPSSHGF